MAALGDLDAASYRERLERVPGEWNLLDAACRVTISRFYRDRAVLDALRLRLLPERARVAVAQKRPLRCWSAGCCSGEEPYSLALILRHALQRDMGELSYEILATDADAFLIQRAQEGSYPGGSLIDVPKEWQAIAFQKEAGRWRLRPEYRIGIQWSVEDLRTTIPDGPFDVILCRNLAFTYFAPSLQVSTGRALIDRLVPGGLLVIGRHEHLPEELQGLEPDRQSPSIFHKRALRS